MSKINTASVKKTLYYLRRNGFKNTCYAVREQLAQGKQEPYCWTPPEEAELARQREVCQAWENACTFSIVVPCYRTAERHLLEMIESVCHQTYPHWELILADATEDDSVESIVSTLTDQRIHYVHLDQNAGIAENTNRGIEIASGDYVGLLDHDDLLTEDALYWMAMAIEEGRRRGVNLKLLYSDEDKCNGDGTEYYEPNYKEEFNLDLLLSNNYICHFMVMERELIQALLLRREYDGAQDHDLVLRAAAKLDGQQIIAHVPRVLYHWRCHEFSTAANPQSKLYAYEAGRRAVQDFVCRKGWDAVAVDTPHLGFFRLEYGGSPLAVRADVGAVGGPLICGGKICGGKLGADGTVYYRNLPRHFSGYMHRAVLPQDAEALDLRNLQIRREAEEIFERVVGVPWKTLPGQEIFDTSTLPQGADITHLSLALGQALRAVGYRLLYLPQYEKVLNNE